MTVVASTIKNVDDRWVLPALKNPVGLPQKRSAVFFDNYCWASCLAETFGILTLDDDV